MYHIGAEPGQEQGLETDGEQPGQEQGLATGSRARAHDQEEVDGAEPGQEQGLETDGETAMPTKPQDQLGA